MIRKALLFSMAALVAGCAAIPERPPVEDPAGAWRARQAALAAVAHWEIRGRLAVKTADEGWQASLVWVRAGDRHRIDLSGPLGGGHVRLTQDANGAQLRDSAQKVYRDHSAEQLLKRATGWTVPLEGLNYWMLGLPAPRSHAEHELDAWGRLKALRQIGWDVRFLEYASHGAHELPSKVFIKNAETSGLEVRLVIEQWSVKSKE